jgi:hypothetical protein
MGEVQICRILTNRPIFDRILHANRKGRQYGVFWECLIYQEEERSPIWAYFPSGTAPGPAWFHPTFLVYVTTGSLGMVGVVELFQEDQKNATLLTMMESLSANVAICQNSKKIYG